MPGFLSRKATGNKLSGLHKIKTVLVGRQQSRVPFPEILLRLFQAPHHPCNSRINNASTKRFRPTPQKRPPRNSLSRKGFRDHGTRLRTYSLLTPSEMEPQPVSGDSSLGSYPAID